MTIFFSVGEPSGDLHGANLIRALRARRPDAQFVGYGGPLMQEAGCRLHADLTRLAVMWFLRVLLNLHRFLHLVSLADRYFRHHRPDAVVLIDYPGFNWWIARRAKVHGIPVFYYTPPQIWAWASWRVGKMRRFVDHVLCSLPFEEPWFRRRGCRATFVGHPYFDEVRRQQVDEAFVERMRQQPGPLVTILPGSRTQEVQQNLRWFLKAAELVRLRVPEVRFAIAAFRPHQAEFARRLVSASELPIPVYVRRTGELIQAATCCMAVSGSVSLELLYHARPTVVLYWISRFAHFVQGFFRQVPYITLVNLLDAGDPLAEHDAAAAEPQDEAQAFRRELFPEYLTCGDRSLHIAFHVIEWLVREDVRRSCTARLEQLRREVGHGGASVRGAEYILEVLDRRPRPIARPHFVPRARVAA